MGTITASDRARLLHHLRRTAGAVCDGVRNTSAEQWEFHAPEGGWCVSEIVEHIVKSESVIFDRVQELLTSPAQPQRDQTPEIDAFLLQRIPHRAKKVEAPPDMIPTRGFTTPATALDAFQNTRAQTMHYIERTDDDLRAHTGEHYLLKTLDCYQWLLLVAVHTERHLAQWAELRAHPRFPAAVEAHCA
jgi:hypothetical protein